MVEDRFDTTEFIHQHEDIRELVTKRIAETGKYECIIYEKSDGIATITMNRPHRRNAQNQIMGPERRHALEDAFLDDSINVIIITGAGGAFCSGDDIKDMWLSPQWGARRQSAGAARLKALPTVNTSYLSGIRKPIIAVLPGVAVGAGLVLALACDIRITDKNGKFGWFFVRRGIPSTMSPIGMMRLLYIMGLGRATEFLLLGELMGAEEAVEVGLANKLVPAEKLMDEARAMAQKLMKDSTPLARLAVKQLIHCAMFDPTHMAELCRDVGSATRQSGDFSESARAFAEKRPQAISGT